MRAIHAHYDILTTIHRDDILKDIEMCGRVCYKSEDKITDESAPKFVRMICNRNHESVLEHVSLTVRLTVDRGVSHELVRHRIASFSQESTRYCNYAKKGLEFVVPSFLVGEIQDGTNITLGGVRGFQGRAYLWLTSMLESESSYLQAIAEGWQPQQARALLPHSVKTEVIMTANLREWAHVFNLRCADAAHPDMRAVMCPLRDEFRRHLPEIFG